MFKFKPFKSIKRNLFVDIFSEAFVFMTKIIVLIVMEFMILIIKIGILNKLFNSITSNKLTFAKVKLSKAQEFTKIFINSKNKKYLLSINLIKTDKNVY